MPDTTICSAKFRRLLKFAAEQGGHRICTGLSQKVEAALTAVRAAAPNPP